MPGPTAPDNEYTRAVGDYPIDASKQAYLAMKAEANARGVDPHPTGPTYVSLPDVVATPDRWAKSRESLTEAMNSRTEASDRPTVITQLRGLEYDLQQAHEAFTDLRRQLASVMPEVDSPVSPRTMDAAATNREPSDLLLHTIGLRNQTQNLIDRIRTAIMDTDL